MSQVIRAEMDLVAVFRQTRRNTHDARITHQDIQTRGGESLRGGFDRGKGGQVAFEKGEFGVGDGGFDGLDEGGGGLGVPPAEVDVGGIVLCEREDGFVPDAGGAWGWVLVSSVRGEIEVKQGGLADRL